jgi:hypothetical protein
VTIWWTFSDNYETERNLTTNYGIEILRRGQKVSMLSIEAVKARHRGNYTCHAHNKAGIATQSATLAINGDYWGFFDNYSEFCNFFQPIPSIMLAYKVCDIFCSMCLVNNSKKPLKTFTG